jgi:PKD repeat protein
VPLDLAFAIDTTGSMGGIIGQVRDNIQALARSIASTSSNYRFALVDYKDFGDVYQARVDLPFSTDVGAFSTAASALQASGGGDYPESMYSGIMTALGLSWRPGVRKVVLVIGDAPGKDPEPGTGYTLAQVRDKALAVDPAQVYAVSASSDPAVADFMRAVADATGGQLTDAPDQATFVSKLQETIVQAGSAPVADLGGPYEAVTGDPVTLTAGGSRDESEDIVSYDWDFDGDGTYDETTTDPVAHHAYPAAGSVTAVVRVHARSGLAATATAQVTVADPPTQPPGAPQDLTGVGGDGTVTLAWQAATTGEPASWFTITDADGNVIDLISAGPGGSAPIGWVQGNLTNGQSYGYEVSAGNIVGSSPFAGPVTVTPGAPDTSSSGQRLALVAGGRPLLVVTGRVMDGGFTVSLSGGSVERLSGTAHVGGRSVTLSVVRRGASWSATARVTDDGGSARSLTGEGTVRSAGRVVTGHFRAAAAAHPWGFSLTRPAGRR